MWYLTTHTREFGGAILRETHGCTTEALKRDPLIDLAELMHMFTNVTVVVISSGCLLMQKITPTP